MELSALVRYHHWLLAFCDYTGLVFRIDIIQKSKNLNIINGGRYDNLLSDLGSAKKTPAVGAALNLNY